MIERVQRIAVAGTEGRMLNCPVPGRGFLKTLFSCPNATASNYVGICPGATYDSRNALFLGSTPIVIDFSDDPKSPATYSIKGYGSTDKYLTVFVEKYGSNPIDETATT